MENNEIMVNEEIIETMEEAVVDRTFNDGVMYGIGGTLIVAGGYILGKKFVVPAIKKFVAKKKGKDEAEAMDEDNVIDDVEFEEKA